MPEASGFVRSAGDFLAVEGPCVLDGLIFQPDAEASSANVYDGLDVTSGKMFCRFDTATQTTLPLLFPGGVRFDSGIYVHTNGGTVVTTVLFHNVE